MASRLRTAAEHMAATRSKAGLHAAKHVSISLSDMRNDVVYNTFEPVGPLSRHSLDPASPMPLPVLYPMHLQRLDIGHKYASPCYDTPLALCTVQVTCPSERLVDSELQRALGCK